MTSNIKLTSTIIFQMCINTFKYVSKPDQLFPLFVMDTLGHIPGVPGLFVAGIFSGALRYILYTSMRLLMHLR